MARSHASEHYQNLRDFGPRHVCLDMAIIGLILYLNRAVEHLS